MKTARSEDLTTQRVILLNYVDVEKTTAAKFMKKLKRACFKILGFLSLRSNNNSKLIKNDILKEISKQTDVSLTKVNSPHVLECINADVYKVGMRVTVGKMDFNSYSRLYARTPGKVLNISKADGEGRLKNLKKVLSPNLLLQTQQDASRMLNLLNTLYADCSKFESKYDSQVSVKGETWKFVINSKKRLSESFLVQTAAGGRILNIQYNQS